MPELTDEQIAIVRALGECFTTEDLAVRFSLSVSAMKHKLTALFNLTGCDNRCNLTIWAVRHAYIVVEPIEPITIQRFGGRGHSKARAEVEAADEAI